ncbi:uncharacterized protein JN550_002514 [Neoarthrinium moseri]|uniref:uncharacterized protein n=1 Tax=Neoarthrinium moseri TaxID=1658444 RepID=UPI001FDBC74B|nr:uncharacterized protein JN550_002514 [Neoarthrinium moseri]KAI1875085.1 hypothetical protein JN550_002514 [Neoarthrinium moseri]
MPMEGTLNFRDLGGYVTNGNKHVVPRRIFRSANLSQITASDIETLQSLGINTVIDFRGPKESQDNPDRLPPGTDYYNSPVIGTSAGDNIDDYTISQLVKAASLPDSMLEKDKVLKHGPYYRMLYLVNSYGSEAHVNMLRAYRPLFQKLLTFPQESNLLFHCTGGRDRTGVGAALLLKTLGVADDAIEADFVASNTWLQPDRDEPDSTRFLCFHSANVFLQPSANKRFQRVAQSLCTTPDRIRGAVELRPELLRRMFQAVDTKYGSFDAFLNQELGIDADKRAHLQRLYTL